MRDTFANRLQIAINSSGLKPIEVSNKTGIDKSLISCYLSGRYEAGNKNIEKLAKILNVSEPWLKGYDVEQKQPINDNSDKVMNNLQTLTKIFKEKGIIDTNETLTAKEIEELFEFMKRNKDLVIKKKGE